MQPTERFHEALDYAVRLHAAQRRKGSDTPYFAHLLGVTAIVLEHDGDEDEAIAALLHDAIEDQGGAATRDQIQQRFGKRVAAIVEGCTDADTVPKPPWRDRKEKYLAHLGIADRSVLLVSAADKLHNARSVLEDYRQHGELLWQRFTGGRDGSLWYYHEVANTLAARLPGPLTDELRRTVDELVRITGA